MSWKASILLVVASISAVALAGCNLLDALESGEFAPTEPEPEPVISSVTVIPDEIQLEPGQTVEVRVDIESEGVEGITVEWESGSPDVATVEPTGERTARVTGRSAGTASITATVDATNADLVPVSASASVQVAEEDPAIESVSVNPSTVTLEEGQSADLTADVRTSGDVQGLDISWASADPDVASVSGDGTTATVTATEAGTTTITATASADNVDGSKNGSASLEVQASGFSIMLTTDYHHNPSGSNPPSVVCGLLTYDPPRIGATYDILVNGPDVRGEVPVTGTLDDTERLPFEVGIGSFGDYTVEVEVTDGETTETRTETVNVTSSQSTCPS